MAKILELTYRYKFTGVKNLRLAESMTPQGGFVFATWHEMCTTGILAQKNNPYTLLVSASKDGEIVEYICRRIGMKAIRGSSTRGGKEAREEIVQTLKEGNPVAFTVDGPKGPRHQCRPGVIDVAMKSRVPIIPMVAVPLNPFIFKKSWDQHQLPLPFSPVIFRYGTPFQIPESLSEEEFKNYQQQVESSIFQLENEARQDLERWNSLRYNRKQIKICRPHPMPN